MVAKWLVAVVVVATGFIVCRAQEGNRPSMAFMAIKGMKSEMTSEDKRAPLGFNGMRGKKSEDTMELYDKRAPQMGFMGMRGKKDSQDYLWDIDEVKKAQAGFFGMRGKKGPSGFFGMRGKKGPSGFFGMRGKKGPSGFMGVRGKKDNGQRDIESLIQLLQDSALVSENDEADSRLRGGSAGFSNHIDMKSQLH